MEMKREKHLAQPHKMWGWSDYNAGIPISPWVALLAVAVSGAWESLSIGLEGWKYLAVGAGPQTLDIQVVLPVQNSGGVSPRGFDGWPPPHCLTQISHNTKRLQALWLLFLEQGIWVCEDYCAFFSFPALSVWTSSKWPTDLLIGDGRENVTYVHGLWTLWFLARYHICTKTVWCINIAEDGL